MTVKKRAGSISIAKRGGGNRRQPVLVVVDWWEKLAGASLALSAVICLCQKQRLSLVAPVVQSSMLLPAPSAVDGRTWPLSAYYDTDALQSSLSPQQLVSFQSWQLSARRQSSRNTTASRPLLLAIVYDDMPGPCVAAMRAARRHHGECPATCLVVPGIRRLTDSALRWIGAEVAERFERACIRASDVRAAILEGSKLGGNIGEFTAGATFMRSLVAGRRAVALLNFRRHDQGRPMLPLQQANELRASAVRPSNRVRAAARRFLRTLGSVRASGETLREAGSTGSSTAVPAYAVAHLRSNHVVHSIYEQGSRAARPGASSSSLTSSSSSPNSVSSPATSPASSTSASSTSAATALCSQRVAACTRRLTRAVRRVSSASATVVASDLATIQERNQDGASHRRHAYMRQCFVPSLPVLRRWYQRTGVAFNCSRFAPGDGAQIGTHSPSGTSQSTAQNSGGGIALQLSDAALACDAGWLGLVDLVLASEATHFVAVEVKTPWRSAFLEWIVMLRRQQGRGSDLISC